MTTLIMTPLPEERIALLSSLEALDLSTNRQSIGPLETYTVSGHDFVIAQGGHGKTQFAVQTRYLLDQLPEVRRVVCIGAAGALQPGLNVGDVVIGSVSVEHDYLLKFATRPDPAFPADPAMLSEVRALSPLSGAARHVGIIASGDEDIIDPERAGLLRDQTNALAVAWEGAGAFRACALTGVACLELRGLTDNADHTAPADFETNLSIAMANVAFLLHGWITRAV